MSGLGFSKDKSDYVRFALTLDEVETAHELHEQTREERDPMETGVKYSKSTTRKLNRDFELDNQQRLIMRRMPPFHVLIRTACEVEGCLFSGYAVRLGANGARHHDFIGELSHWKAILFRRYGIRYYPIDTKDGIIIMWLDQDDEINWQWADDSRGRRYNVSALSSAYESVKAITGFDDIHPPKGMPFKDRRSHLIQSMKPYIHKLNIKSLHLNPNVKPDKLAELASKDPLSMDDAKVTSFLSKHAREKLGQDPLSPSNKARYSNLTKNTTIKSKK